MNSERQRHRRAAENRRPGEQGVKAACERRCGCSAIAIARRLSAYMLCAHINLRHQRRRLWKKRIMGVKAEETDGGGQ